VFSQRSNYLLIRRLCAAALALSPILILIGCASAGPHVPPPEGALTLSATSFDFSTVVVGKTSTQTLNLSNAGNAPLTLNALTLKSQQFEVTGPSLPRTILPSQSVSYSVSFTPTTSGSLSASLEITTNVSAASTAVSLAGVAEKAFVSLQASPSSLSFGNLNLNTTGTQNVTLKNTGDINMTISGITVSGVGFGYSNLAPGFSLAPNQTVTFQVWFKPKTAGNASGTISILSANMASPQEIPVSGDGTNPPPTFATLQVSPASLSFGNLNLNATGTQNVTLKNTGDIYMTISGITVSGAGFGYSNLAPGFSLAPNQTVTFQVWFKPKTAGNASGTISILSANIASPQEIPVSGDGTNPPPTFATLQVSPASLSFGNLNLKATASQNVTLKNTGTINMTVSGITVVGAGFGYSDISPGFSLAPNQTVTFQVWFDPQKAGSASGSVTVLSPNIASPEEILVSGTGVSTTPPPSQPPAPPTQHTVGLSWQESSSSVSGYRVYRSTTSGSGFSPLTSTISSLSYTDDTVSNGVTYYYVVTAVDSAGSESPYSNQVTAVIPTS
jgi:Abnormal spindle-like microcephaly-assoc'd, ASPM-SPD-2-Hydin